MASIRMAAVTVVACIVFGSLAWWISAPDNPHAAPAGPKPQGPAPTGHAAAPSQVPVSPGWAGLVARVACDTSGRITVDGFDPNTWALAAQADFPSPLGVAARLNDGAVIDVAGGIATALCPPAGAPSPETTEQIEAGEMFDPEFNRLAVSITRPGRYSHVGYIDRAGQLTDVTASDGRGATSSEYNPVFTRDGRGLLYAGPVANGARPLYVRDVTNGARSNAGTLTGDTGVPLETAPAGAAVSFSGGEIAAPAPTGTAVAIGGPTTGGDSSLSIWHLPTAGPADGHGYVGVLHTSVGAPPGEPWQLAACSPQGWADASTVLCMAEGSGLDLGAPQSAVYTVRVNAGPGADGGRIEEAARAVGAPLFPTAGGTLYGEATMIGGDVWCWAVQGGTGHAQVAPLAGGPPHAVPAADGAFGAPGFFLLRGAAHA